MNATRLRLERLESRDVPSAALNTFDIVSGSAPRGIVTGKDGALWFTEFGAGAVGRMTLSGERVDYLLPTPNSGPSDITIGVDGNFWVTETKANRIARVTPTGVVTEFTLPAGSEPTGITSGPDDKIWFTLTGSNQIGRLSPKSGSSIQIQASIAKFSIPTSGSGPLDIAAGPDGALWFTESARDRIGRIATNGSVTNEFVVPGSGSRPTNIVSAPDGNLWFTQKGSDQIGRIATNGSVTEFGVGGAGSGLSDITVGPDGNLWFTQTDSHQVGRVTLAGDVREFDAPGGPRGITTGPDGFLWIAHEQSSQIGRFGLAAPAFDLGGDASVTTNANFTRAGSFTDDDGLTWSATVDYGDGVETLALSGRNFQLSHTYASEGKFEVVVQITNGFSVGEDRFTVFVDTTPPTAQLIANDFSIGDTYTFRVTYSDATGINTGSIDNNDVIVKGPNGTPFATTLVSVDATTNGSPRTATYRVLPPGGSWESGDNGAYTIAIQTGEVGDIGGNTVIAGDLGKFQVNLADATSTVPPGTVPPGTVPLTNVPILPASPMVVRGYAVGSDAGGEPKATLYDGSGKVVFSVMAFEGSFRGGVRVATGDINADGVLDLIVASGPGRANEVRLFDGKTKKSLGAIAAFESSFAGGLYVASADINLDGYSEIVISADEGGGPRVKVIDGKTNKVIADFFGIDDPNFRGGARVTVGDINGDGAPDILVGAGFGGGPRVAGFNGKMMTASGMPPKLFDDFFVFELGLRNGIYLTSGDINGDGFDDLIAGGGPGGGPRVYALSGWSLMPSNGGLPMQFANFFAGDSASRSGVRVATTSIDGDNRADIVTGVGPGEGSGVSIYAGKSLPTDGPPSEMHSHFDAFNGFGGGVFVG